MGTGSDWEGRGPDDDSRSLLLQKYVSFRRHLRIGQLPVIVDRQLSTMAPSPSCPMHHLSRAHVSYGIAGAYVSLNC